MKKFFLATALCLSLSACETTNTLEWPSLSSLNPFGNDEVTKVEIRDEADMAAVPVVGVNQSAVETELNELEQLTGDHLKAVESIKTQKNTITENTPINNDPKLKLSSAKGCPHIEIMPAARSITYFEDNMSGQMIARASINEIRGGCEVVSGGMELDLDILMKGTITNKGRFEGRVDEEAFMTFPYFITVSTPQGLPVDKEIMATTMRFRPSVDHLDHAEKITQFIPMDTISQADNYKITVGYQLTRKQLEYNRIETASRPDDTRVSPDTSKAKRRSYNPLADE